MKILAISGSRNPEGQTARAMNAFLNGAASAGASAEKVFLPAVAIERCRQCDAEGWGLCRKEARCVIEDDFAALVERVRGCDALVVATPVYYDDLSESVLAFLGRLRRICTFDETRDGIEGKPAVGICVAGGRGKGASNCCGCLEKILLRCGFDVVDMVPVRRQNLEMKCETLGTIGRWFAAGPAS